MKRQSFQKQTINKLNSDYKVVNFLFISLAIVIFLSFGFSFYKTLIDNSESLNFVPIALLPILILMGSKRYQIKKEIDVRRAERH